MARPIRNINRHVPTRQEQREQSAAKLLEGAADRSEGLLVFLDIIEEMHKAGYLEIIQGMLKNRDKVATHALDLIQVAGLPIVMKNLVTGMQFMSRLEPVKVQRLLNAVSSGMDNALTEDPGHTGLLGMLKSFKDPEVNRSVTFLLRFLRGMGEELDEDYRQINRNMNRDKQEMMDQM